MLEIGQPHVRSRQISVTSRFRSRADFGKNLKIRGSQSRTWPDSKSAPQSWNAPPTTATILSPPTQSLFSRRRYRGLYRRFFFQFFSIFYFLYSLTADRCYEFLVAIRLAAHCSICLLHDRHCSTPQPHDFKNLSSFQSVTFDKCSPQSAKKRLEK